MDEEKPKEEEERKEETASDTKEGDKPETTPLIRQANEAAERLEQANKEKEKLLAREEEIEAKRTLGGKSEAGVQQEKPKPLSDVEYSKALQRGEVDPLAEDGFI